MENSLPKPFISVVMPVYNKERHVSRSIQSVLDQSFEGFELIIVCDPSTDSSSSEVAKFDDARIRVFHRKEAGPGGYAARNLGVRKAEAEWIAFLDADDIYVSEHLENSFNIIENNQPDVAIFSYNLMESGNATSRTPPSDLANRFVNRCEVIKLLKTDGNIHTNTIIIKTNILKKSGGFPSDKGILRGGDVDTWLRVFLRSNRIWISDRISSVYFFDESGVISDKKNTLTEPAVYLTLIEILDSKNRCNISENELIAIKKLSNVKIFGLVIGRKLAGEHYFNLINKIQWTSTDLSFLLKLFLAIFLPVYILKKIV